MNASTKKSTILYKQLAKQQDEHCTNNSLILLPLLQFSTIVAITETHEGDICIRKKEKPTTTTWVRDTSEIKEATRILRNIWPVICD